MSDSDKKILGELYMICAENAQYIQNLLYKVEDEELNTDMNRQLGKCISYKNRIENKIENKVSDMSDKGLLQSTVNKIKIWSEIQRKTAFNNSTVHLAKLLIGNDSKIIAYILKVMHDYPESECCELAKELIEFEEMNIEELKYYLSKQS